MFHLDRLFMLHKGFICFNSCCMWDLFVLIYVAFICFNLFGDTLFYVDRLRFNINWLCYMYNPNRSVSAS